MTKEELGTLILNSERQLYSTAKTILINDQDCADAIQDTKVVNIQTRRVKKWTGARVAAAIAVCVLATSTIVYAGTKLYHMFLEKQGAYSIVTGIKADGSTGKINLPEKIHDIDISAGYIPEVWNGLMNFIWNILSMIEPEDSALHLCF